MNLIQTALGLPNNCFICGKKVTTATWAAPHEDAARSGLGGHKKCFVDQAKEEAKVLMEEAEALEKEAEE